MALDDDDNPLATPKKQAPEQSLDDDEEEHAADWTSLGRKKSISSKSIRKGEKDFESHGTRRQDDALENSRLAMEEALGYTRFHRKDDWCRGWLFSPENDEDITRAEGERVVVVEVPRTTHFNSLGRVLTKRESRDGVGRMWLLPEEALFLVERGLLDLWWPYRSLREVVPKEMTPADVAAASTDDYDVGLPLSLEAAYSFLIGEEGEPGKITLAKYQVYAHLKRSGIYVLRAPENPEPPAPTNLPPEPTLWQWLMSLIPEKKQDLQPWGPLVQPGVYRNYRSIYKQLSLIPRHMPTPTVNTSVPEAPWKVFFHIWKAGGKPFAKSSPPPPDFRIAVTDTYDDGLPTLEQLDALWGSCAPFDDPRNNPAWQGPWKMYPRLKQGYRSVLVAVVDAGLVNFMRFGEGAFAVEDVVGRMDRQSGGAKRGGGRGGGRGGRGGRGRGRGRGRR